MNFRVFSRKYSNYPVIKSSYFALEERPAYIRRLVSEWVKKGWLIELRRGMYLINSDSIIAATERFSLANLLYEPSYVSLESALSFHGMIPEAVQQVTSVGTRKTARFLNQLGTFTYASIKRELFWGVRRYKLQRSTALIATPEKALLDLVYLRRGEFKSAIEVIESLRLLTLPPLKSQSLLDAAKRFDNTRVLDVAKGLIKELRRTKA